MASETTLKQLQGLYIAYFGRPAEGTSFWENRFDNLGWTIDDAARDFVNADEFTAVYGSADYDAVVRATYLNALGRDVESAQSRDFWVGELEAGRVSVATLLDSFLTTDSEIDRATAEGRIEVASAYTEKVQAGAPYEQERAIELLQSVDSTASSRDAALSAIQAQAVPEQPDPGSGGSDHGITAASDFIDLGGSTDKRDVIVLSDAAYSRITDSSGDGRITINPDTAASKLDTIDVFVTGDWDIADRIDLTAFGFTGSQRGVKNVTESVDQFTELSHVAGLFDTAYGARGVAYSSEHVHAENSGTDLDGGFGSLWVFIDANKDGDFTASEDMVIDLGGILAVSAVDFYF